MLTAYIPIQPVSIPRSRKAELCARQKREARRQQQYALDRQKSMQRPLLPLLPTPSHAILRKPPHLQPSLSPQPASPELPLNSHVHSPVRALHWHPLSPLY